ncbi:hypothetical protein GSI_05155 [Ganoderma sinense ZZ0214-1]|uniref:Fungal-type protein kinase domain-containing protein n=1 Tax=Ganoderma sinense ZZ0214-1 TaxID=1077348 RepID=A0A2G8SFC5_9APHY|nr:hypothetical protein GSI_05155 [Ganoderma sinense ZZ0214-1]
MPLQIQSTPFNHRYSSMHYSSVAGELGAHSLNQYRLRIADDMAHQSVLFTMEEFRDLLLPDPSDPRFSKASRPNVRTNPFTALHNAKNMSELDISIALLQAINKHKLVPGCKAARCESRPDPRDVDPDGQKIDAALFDKKADVSSGQPQWADQGVPIEFKHDLDPFDDSKKKKVNADASSRKKVRGQVTHYAELIMSIQQRLFLFMFVIIGRKFRILRWDRSGVVVSEAVDYVDDWEVFCDILWRISLAHCFAPEMLGMDPSAVRLRSSDREWRRMTAAANANPNDVDVEERHLEDDEVTEPFTFKYVRDAFRQTLVKDYPRYRVEVPAGDKTRCFLICCPIFQAKGLAGRGTRGYIALEYDPTQRTKRGKRHVDQFFFLKDTWRMKYDGVSPEGNVLDELNQAGVEYVPTLVCHGDIGNPVQETMTPQYWRRKHLNPPAPRTSDTPAGNSSSSMLGGLKHKRSDDASGPSHDMQSDDESEEEEDAFATGCPIRSHVHYRCVVKEVGKSLSASETGRKMLRCVIDSVRAHEQAYKLNILHRDISAGNIIIYPKVEIINGKRSLRWVGLLTDWEMSKRTDQSPRRRQPERTGTWQFMSYGLLRDGTKVVELCDDLEAFFYVILYFAVRYLDSNCQDVATYIEDFFDCYTVLDGVYYIGHQKRFAIEHAVLQLTGPGDVLSFKTQPMNNAISDLLASFAAHYKILAYEKKPKPAISSLPLIPAGDLAADDDDDDEGFLIPDAVVAKPRPTRKKVDTSPAPTEEERTFAKNATDHTLFLDVLSHALVSPGWHKVWQDRISPDWVSSRELGPPANGKRSKKQKMERCPSLFHAVSAPPHTPPKASGSRRGSRQSGRGTRGSGRGAQRPAAENQHQMSLRSRNH